MFARTFLSCISISDACVKVDYSTPNAVSCSGIFDGRGQRDSFSDVGDAWYPCLYNPLHFLDEASTGDLCRADLVVGIR